jgi:hypothetical protein
MTLVFLQEVLIDLWVSLEIVKQGEPVELLSLPFQFLEEDGKVFAIV